jgi:hypothetical protein
MYHCAYCNELHDDATMAIEHIVPRVLLNDKLVLPDTCRWWNNFFARSFEGTVTTSEYITDLLRAFDPNARKGGPWYLGTVETHRGTTEHRWLKNGVEFLGPAPSNRVDTHDLPVVLRDASGREIRVEIPIPFPVTTQAQGPSDRLEKIRTRAEANWGRAEEYIAELVADPSKNPAFAKVIAASGISLDSGATVGRTVATIPAGPPQVVADILPKRYPIVHELWSKFYLKIGWCFAAKKLGASALWAHGGEIPLALLKHGQVDAAVIADCAEADPPIAARLFRSANIDGRLSGSGTPTSPRLRRSSTPSQAQFFEASCPWCSLTESPTPKAWQDGYSSAQDNSQ